MSGQLRVDEITDEAGTGSPSFPQKITPSSLGTGTPDATNFLRGDGAWEIVDVEGEIADFAAGEPGQPRLVGNAVDNFVNYPVLTITAADTVSIGNIGYTVTQTTGGWTDSATFVEFARRVIDKYTGSVRFEYTANEAYEGGCSFEVRILKNSVVAQTSSGTLTNGQSLSFSIDINVIPTDIITVEARKTGGGGRVRGLLGGTASNTYVLKELFGPSILI